MGFQEKKAELVDTLSVLPDRFERLEWIVDEGRKSAGLEASERTEENFVEGCQSQLWLVGSLNDGKCFYRADSDSGLVKGLAGIICSYYSGETPEDILQANTEFLREVGIEEHLSSNRRNGLTQIQGKIKAFAAERCNGN